MKNKEIGKDIVALLLTIVFCVIAVAIVLLILINTFDEKRKEDNKKTNNQPVVNTYSAGIFFGGKVDVDEELIADYHIDGQEDYYNLIENVEPAITNNDVAIFQLDDVVVENYQGEGVPKNFVDQFSSMGFSMISLASEGQLELGEEKLLESHNYWGQGDLYKAGSSSTDANTTDIYEKNGITFGLLAYTLPENISEYTLENPYLLEIYSDKNVIDDIKAIRDQVDIILVYLDWDDVDSFEVTSEQERIVKSLADSGADIILGTNTGSIQPVEWLGGTIVYYSLGNFVSDAKDIEERIGLIGSLYIQKTVVDGKITIEKSQAKADLVYIDKKPTKVILFDEINNQLPNKEAMYEKYSSIIAMRDDSIRVGGIK